MMCENTYRVLCSTRDVQYGRGETALLTHMLEHEIAPTHMHFATREYMHTLVKIWMYSKKQLLSVNKLCIMHRGEGNLMLDTQKKRQKHTCDGVRVKVPGLLCNVENSRDKCFYPRWQFTESKKKRRRMTVRECKRRRERDYGGRRRDPEWFLCHL